MTSAEKRFTELLDAGLILAKSTQGYVTKMGPDIILKSPSAINNLSPCLSILLLAFAAENFWKLDHLQRHYSQSLPQRHRYCHDSLQGARHLWILEPKPADPGTSQRVHCNKEFSAVNIASWSISHSLTQKQGALLWQLRPLVPWHQTHGLHSYERLFLLLPSSQPAAK